MRGSRRWSAEEKELEHTIPIFRAAPGEVLAEREAADQSQGLHYRTKVADRRTL